MSKWLSMSMFYYQSGLECYMLCSWKYVERGSSSSLSWCWKHVQSISELVCHTHATIYFSHINRKLKLESRGWGKVLRTRTPCRCCRSQNRSAYNVRENTSHTTHWMLRERERERKREDSLFLTFFKILKEEEKNISLLTNKSLRRLRVLFQCCWSMFSHNVASLELESYLSI